MQISPLGSPVDQFVPPTTTRLPAQLQAPVFQLSTPKAPTFQASTFTPPAPKVTTRQSRRLSTRRGETLVDPHYNQALNLAPYGIDTSKTGFVGNIETLSKANQNFRTVVYTTDSLQLVVMALKADEEIGSEIHRATDQFFRIETGTGIVEIDGVRRPYADGTAIQIPKGMQHNVIAQTPTKLYTIYSPPHHK